MKLNLFSYGFRSQFFLAGIGALILIPVWAVSFVAGTPIGSAWPPTLWHAHEMLFGFIACAMAGFVLTAVPSWTGQKGFAGAPLLALSSIWVAARILIATSGWWPLLLPAVVELAFLPLLMLLVALPLVRSRNRNTPVLAILGAFWLTDVVFHVALMHHDAPLARNALIVGIDITLLLVTVIGGRLVPAFTTSALRQRGVDLPLKSRTAFTVLAVAAMVGVVVGDVFWPDRPIAGGFAGIAALLQAVRLLQWRSARTLGQPIVWILHLAYVWLPIGLALKAAALLGGYAIAAFWLHALTIGVLATMIMAVMTRASLGHTGRPLIVHPLIAVAYGLLTAAAVVRVFGLSLGLKYPEVIALAAILWTASFVLFVGIYSPILWGPRADGKPG